MSLTLTSGTSADRSKTIHKNKKSSPNKVDLSILHPCDPCVPWPAGTSHGIVEFVHLGAVVTSKDQHSSLMDHHTAGILGETPTGTLGKRQRKSWENDVKSWENAVKSWENDVKSWFSESLNCDSQKVYLFFWWDKAPPANRNWNVGEALRNGVGY